MPTNELNLDYLQQRINSLKNQNTESTEFCLSFIECLMKRHNLSSCITSNFVLEDVPDEILNSIRAGKVPTKQDIFLLSSELQNWLCFELLWVCGMGALIDYGAHLSEDLDEESTMEIIINMREQGEEYYIGSYIIAALTLLMGQIPSQSLILTLTNNFDPSKEQLQKNVDVFIEFAASILTRYQEDLEYK
jgi:hypothetical protein